MKFPLALALALTIPVLPACYLDYDGGGWDDGELRGPGPSYAPESNLTVDSPRMAGDLGRVDITGDAIARSAYDTGDGAWSMTYIELWAGDTRGDAMVGLTLDGVTASELVPGVSYRASVIACSGPDEYNWEYDQWTEDVVVDIEAGETPDTIVVSFRAQVPVDYDSRRVHDIEGSVVVQR